MYLSGHSATVTPKGNKHITINCRIHYYHLVKETLFGCVCVYVKYHYGKTRNLACPRKPRDRWLSVETVAIRAAGPCRWVAGWLAFPGAPTPAWPPPPTGAGRPHGILLACLKKLRKTHENDDSNFPKTVVNTVTGWKNSTSSPPPRSDGYISTSDCIVLLLLLLS